MSTPQQQRVTKLLSALFDYDQKHISTFSGAVRRANELRYPASLDREMNLSNIRFILDKREPLLAAIPQASEQMLSYMEKDLLSTLQYIGYTTANQSDNPLEYIDPWGLETNDAQAAARYTDNIIQDLIPLTDSSRPGTEMNGVKAVVMHYVQSPNQKPEDTIKYWKKENVTGSAHYVIGTDGRIVQAIPKDEVARHAGSPTGQYSKTSNDLFGDGNNPNLHSIGIEMVNTDTAGNFSKETVTAAVQLTAELLRENNLHPDTALLRHYDTTGKNCPKYYVDNPKEWDNFKNAVKTEINALNNGGSQ